ncbi:hypothetical protein [Paucisalibacillus globulus]|uniref:hypothetical protein n=1 Tax=Paucisalibacillus globulus TaxID=351095 RepID=UPI000BB871BE|nr:hypothetical protein [Paucisalibacillus globulus]
MENKTRTVITLVCSGLIFGAGLFRVLTESISSTSLFIPYVLLVTGLIGVIENGVVLSKMTSK